jgi:hypothetical protein
MMYLNISSGIGELLTGWIVILIIIGIIAMLANRDQIKELNAQNNLIYQEEFGKTKIGTERVNKVISVTVLGGIIGAALMSPMLSLNIAMKKANANGWKVVQVINSDTGNVFHRLGSMFLLIATLFFYTREPGYYLILERKDIPHANQGATTAIRPIAPSCPSCHNTIQDGDNYCENCGKKLS